MCNVQGRRIGRALSECLVPFSLSMTIRPGRVIVTPYKKTQGPSLDSSLDSESCCGPQEEFDKKSMSPWNILDLAALGVIGGFLASVFHHFRKLYFFSFLSYCFHPCYSPKVVFNRPHAMSKVKNFILGGAGAAAAAQHAVYELKEQSGMVHRIFIMYHGARWEN